MSASQNATLEDILIDLREQYDRPLPQVYEMTMDRLVMEVEKIADAETVLSRENPKCTECMEDVVEALEEGREVANDPTLNQNYYTRIREINDEYVKEHKLELHCPEHGHVLNYTERE